MIEWIRCALPVGSVRRWIVQELRRSPWSFPFALVRSTVASWQLVGRIWGLPVRVSAGQPFRVRRSGSAVVELEGVLYVEPWGGSFLGSSIAVGENARLRIGGDFTLGLDVHISVSAGGELAFGGRRNSTGSGITCRSRIMVSERIEIGADSIIAWDVFISDSDWHALDGEVRRSPVRIGEHVWIAHGCSILRGAVIPDGSVVGAKSLVCKAFEGEKLLIKGIPAAVARVGVEWVR